MAGEFWVRDYACLTWDDCNGMLTMLSDLFNVTFFYIPEVGLDV